MDRTLGAWLVVAGVAIAIVGLLVASGALGWFGRLPGDLRFEGRDGGVRVFVPLALVARALGRPQPRLHAAAPVPLTRVLTMSATAVGPSTDPRRDALPTVLRSARRARTRPAPRL